MDRSKKGPGTGSPGGTGMVGRYILAELLDRRLQSPFHEPRHFALGLEATGDRCFASCARLRRLGSSEGFQRLSRVQGCW